jgi:hypothetical protein
LSPPPPSFSSPFSVITSCFAPFPAKVTNHLLFQVGTAHRTTAPHLNFSLLFLLLQKTKLSPPRGSINFYIFCCWMYCQFMPSKVQDICHLCLQYWILAHYR